MQDTVGANSDDADFESKIDVTSLHFRKMSILDMVSKIDIF